MWEIRHQTRYGCGSWHRAVQQAGTLLDWEMEHRGIDAEERLRLVYARPALEREWADQKRLAALVLWRAAYDADVLVDDVVLGTIRRYYGRILGAQALRDGPVPDAAREIIDGDGPSPELLHQVAIILDKHALVDEATPHRIGPLTTVGYRARDLRSTPGWAEGDWTADLRIARKYLDHAWQKREDGSWRVTAADLQAAARAVPVEPTYDYPAAPVGPDGYRLWLQEAHYLLSVGTALAAVAGTLPRTSDGYIGPLAMVLSGHAGACLQLHDSVVDVEHLWSAEPVQPVDLSYWDLSHVPASLLRRTDEIKVLIQDLRVWLTVLAS